MDKYELKSRKKLKGGLVELEFAFSYGLFGYGFSDQLENLVHSPDEILRQSMFPRVRPPEEKTFTKWCLLDPQTVPHPTYIPFSETATDLMPDLFQDQDHTMILNIPKPRQLVKDAMPRLSKLRNEYLGQSGRGQRVKFLRDLIHAKKSCEDGEEESDSGEESSGYIPAGLAAMLSDAARATITQTIPGVTVRSRADYKNLKVDMSQESLNNENVSTSNHDKSSASTSLEKPAATHVMKRLIGLQETLSPRDAKLANSVTSSAVPLNLDNEKCESQMSQNSNDDISQLNREFTNLDAGNK